MRTSVAARFGLILMLTVSLSACTVDSSLTPTPPTAVACAVTLPGPVPADQPWRESLFGSGSAYGNQGLWVGGLGEGGRIPFEPDGRKLAWWRVVPGPLRITGHRLDASAAPLRSAVPSGYGDRGFQSSGVYFSTPGCWEITGTAGSARLTFVTLVG
jgi:hypothetical protein